MRVVVCRIHYSGCLKKARQGTQTKPASGIRFPYPPPGTAASPTGMKLVENPRNIFFRHRQNPFQFEIGIHCFHFTGGIRPLSTESIV